MDSLNGVPEETVNDGSISKDAKRQQFTNKQRMDMYAFCVLELELHSHKVSIRRQQQVAEKALAEKQKEIELLTKNSIQVQHNQTDISISNQQHQSTTQLPPANGIPHTESNLPETKAATTTNQPQSSQSILTWQPTNADQQQHQLKPPEINGKTPQVQAQANNDSLNQDGSEEEGWTLVELHEKLAMTRKCYSDHQKTQVLTSSMLRDVQKRFAKYYPDSAIPSRTTIKHVFDKCVSHGTVENMRNPRKATKMIESDEIEHLLIHEPQLSLRQIAQKLNVSTGTVSRRCRALGLVPDSVTLKHQQMASARRQKQMKQLKGRGKSTEKAIGVEKNGRDEKSS